MPAIPRRPALWAAAGAVAVLQIWGGLHLTSGQKLADLHVYIGSLQTLHAGASLYDYAAPGTGAPFTYPPFAAIALAALPLLPFTLLATLWTLATLAAVTALAGLVERAGTGLAALALICSAPVSSNLRFGQISVFLVLAVMLDTLHVIPPRYRGIATGLAAAVKLTPLIFVPYYWFSGRRRTAATALATFTGATALAWVALPRDSARFWFTTVRNVDRVGNIGTGGNQSLNGVLLRWEVAGDVRTVAGILIGAAVIGLALRRATRACHAGDHLAATVMIGAAGLVFSPVSWTHHQIWLVPAAFVAVSARPRINHLWTAAVLAVMVLPVVTYGDPWGAGNARLWLAVAIATAVPFAALHRPTTGTSASPARVTAP